MKKIWVDSLGCGGKGKWGKMGKKRDGKFCKFKKNSETSKSFKMCFFCGNFWNRNFRRFNLNFFCFNFFRKKFMKNIRKPWICAHFLIFKCLSTPNFLRMPSYPVLAYSISAGWVRICWQRRHMSRTLDSPSIRPPLPDWIVRGNRECYHWTTGRSRWVSADRRAPIRVPWRWCPSKTLRPTGSASSAPAGPSASSDTASFSEASDRSLVTSSETCRGSCWKSTTARWRPASDQRSAEWTRQKTRAGARRPRCPESPPRLRPGSCPSCLKTSEWTCSAVDGPRDACVEGAARGADCDRDSDGADGAVGRSRRRTAASATCNTDHVAPAGSHRPVSRSSLIWWSVRSEKVTEIPMQGRLLIREW